MEQGAGGILVPIWKKLEFRLVETKGNSNFAAQFLKETLRNALSIHI